LLCVHSKGFYAKYLKYSFKTVLKHCIFVSNI
jgi:hypothetical protein